MAREAGKGSGRRPTEVPKEVVDSNWDRIWGKKNTGNPSSMTEQPAPVKDPEEVFDPYSTINS